MENKLYTTWGSVRGDCGHAHKTVKKAMACLQRDRNDCASLPGGNCYSDREIRAIESVADLHNYDVTVGPGERTEEE